MAMSIPVLYLEGNAHTCVVGGINQKCPAFTGIWPNIPFVDGISSE
jgi:hypothetical protein